MLNKQYRIKTGKWVKESLLLDILGLIQNHVVVFVCFLRYNLSGQSHFEALKNGEIMEVDEDGEPQDGSSSSSARGTKYFAFRKVEIGKETGSSSKQELQRKKSITAENSKILDDLMSQLKWSFAFKASDHKCLERGEVPKAMKQLVDKAFDANSRLCQDGMKILKKLEEGTDIWKKLKGEYCNSQRHLCDIKHLLDFHELPNNNELTKANFDGMMLEVAKNTASFNETLEMAKGKVRAAQN